MPEDSWALTSPTVKALFRLNFADNSAGNFGNFGQNSKAGKNNNHDTS